MNSPQYIAPNTIPYNMNTSLVKLRFHFTQTNAVVVRDDTTLACTDTTPPDVSECASLWFTSVEGIIDVATVVAVGNRLELFEGISY